MTDLFGLDLKQYQYLANVLAGLGGLLGGITALVGLPVVLLTWRTSQKDAYRTKVYSILTEKLSAHREIVASMKMGELEGRDVFSAMLREFTAIYRVVARVSQSSKQEWSTKQKIDIAYTFLFFGPTYTCWGELASYDTASIKSISSDVSRLKSKFLAKKLFLGHQNRLSNYFRNLYSGFEFLDNTKLTQSEKLILGKLFRTQMTNYEQALFAFNCLSHYGTPWITTGLLGKFKIIKNIPRLFSELDSKTTFKDLFPYIDFEWENHGTETVKAHRFSMRNVTIYVHRTCRVAVAEQK